jgi:hypothetical protein
MFLGFGWWRGNMSCGCGAGVRTGEGQVVVQRVVVRMQDVAGGWKGVENVIDNQ